jgi:hypothetical protein
MYLGNWFILPSFFIYSPTLSANMRGVAQWLTRQVHNLEDAGSNPALSHFF